MEQRSSKRRDAQSRHSEREVQRRAQQQESEQVSEKEQTVPAAVPPHLPGAIWVQKPQWAQHAALGDHQGVVDVKHGGLGIGRLVVFCLQSFGQKGQREAVEQHSERCIHVLQRVDASQFLGDCRDRDGGGGRGAYEASQQMQKHLKLPLLPVRTKDVPLKMAIRTEMWADGSDGTFRQ